MSEDVTIVGGGWSVRAVDLRHLVGHVIAVNDAAVHLEDWQHAVSMDRLWAENRLAAIWPRCIEPDAGRQVWIRRNALQNFPRGFVDGATCLRAFECDHLSSHFLEAPAPPAYALNGTNSGGCALNLAYQLRPRRVFLLGFDMNQDPAGVSYWYPGYPWASGKISATKYGHWAGQFNAARGMFDTIGARVFNVSPSSSIDCFEKITAADYRSLST